MNDIILSRGARVPPARMVVVLSAEGRQIRRRLAKNLVRSAQLAVLALQLLEPKALLAAQPCTDPAVARHSRGSGNRPDVPICAASPPYTRASTKPRRSPTTANHVHPGDPTPGAPPVPGLPGSILSVKSSALFLPKTQRVESPGFPGRFRFDTCVYHQPGIDLLLEVIPADNILFASEMVGAMHRVGTSADLSCSCHCYSGIPAPSLG